MFGDITVRCRPLRLAFVIPPESAALHKAIQINSSLWGGAFNPIIPLYRRAPSGWKSYPGEKVSVRNRALGYVRAFDPDILVNCTGERLPPYLSDTSRTVISWDDIWEDFFKNEKSQYPRCGIGIFELLGDIYKEYFEFKHRFPSTVVYPKYPKKQELFWSAAIGQLANPIQEDIERTFAEALDIEKPYIDATNYESILKGNVFFPRRITRHRITVEGAGYRSHEAYGFYMDADKFLDVVDFWNLRALGRSVIPIPKQFVVVPEFLQLVRNFVRSEYRESRHNPEITFGTSIIRSFSTTMPELESLSRALNLKDLIPNKPMAQLISLQHWYPRIWDEWAIGKDGAMPDRLHAGVEEFSFPEASTTVAFNAVKPGFAADTLVRSPRYANEVYPKFYGQADTPVADLLPYDHGAHVLRVAGGTAALPDEFRIGRSGLIRLVEWRERTFWKIPLAEDVFLAWLKDKGFDAHLSTCGRLAKQIHSQLNGWLTPLSYEPLLKLLEEMNGGLEGSKGAALGHVKNALKKLDAHGDLYQSLLGREVFQLGYRTQCTYCQRASWHSVRSFASELVCPLCYKKLNAISAVDSNNQGSWHLRTAGPFSVGNYGDGSYSVLLTLNLFERDRSLQATPVLSFNAKHAASGRELEADLGLIWQESTAGETQDGVLFAECKSYNKFERRDFDRMRSIAREFPGAILAFSTLRRNLEVDEIRELRKITSEGMKQWKTERPLNPVLLLTGNELFGFVGPPYCWDKTAIPAWAQNAHGLLELCMATQSIYLGTPHWQETWRSEYEKRTRKRKRIASTLVD